MSATSKWENAESFGFYPRLRMFAKTGQFSRALKLMRLKGLPQMMGAFRTTQSEGGKFRMVFEFESLSAMQQADREWHEFRAAQEPSK